MLEVSGVDLAKLRAIAKCFVCSPARLPVCIAITGTLGAGKTRFAQELLRCFCGEGHDATSPTFTLIQTYSTHWHEHPVELHHVDLYRVTDRDELWELGFDELVEQPNSIMMIEWADRFPDELPSDAIWLSIEYESNERDSTRRWTLTSADDSRTRWLTSMLSPFLS